MRNFSLTREVFIQSCLPEDARLHLRSPRGEVWYYNTATDNPAACAFKGKSNKPAWRYFFKNEAQRQEHVDKWWQGLKEREEAKQAEREATKTWQHGVKVGDIFRCSWGYDQTNIDYYEVVELCGKTQALVKEIGQQSVDTAWLQGECVPSPGRFLTEIVWCENGERTQREKPARRVKIQKGYKGEPYFSAYSFANAYIHRPKEVAPGLKVFAPDHWTAYA